ncbi:MAG: phosphatase PAP2 family protein [Acidobacteriota bacterium]
MNAPSTASIFLATHLLFFTSSVVAALVFYLYSHPPKPEIAATCLGGIALTAYLGLSGPPYVQVMLFLAYWGACALLVSFVGPFFIKKDFKKRVTTLEWMVAPALLEIFGAVMLGFLNRFVPSTYDYYLYAFDTSFGYPPGFLAAQALVAVAPLRVLAEVSYINLTLAMSIAFLMQRSASPEQSRAFFRFVAILGQVGFLFYILFPAVGTEVLFPGKLYHPPSLASMSVLQLPDPREPRNCIPSLHTAWALAIWWTCPRKIWMRVAAAIFVGATMLYTLACGHYLADMIAAVPFTLWIYSWTREGAWASGSIAKRTGLIGLALFLTWLAALRFGTALFLLSPAVPIAFSLATVIYCRSLRRTLDRQIAPSIAAAPAPSVRQEGLCAHEA